MSNKETGSRDINEQLNEAARVGNIPVSQTSDVADKLVGDVLRKMYRKPQKIAFDPETRRLKEKALTDGEKALNAKIEKAWKELYGHEFSADVRLKVRPRGIFGPPGSGKSTAPEVACRFVAEKLDMDFVTAKELPFIAYNHINENTFIFQNLQTAGAPSALEVLGLPSKGKFPGTDIEYLDRLLPQWALKMFQAGGSFLMLDDALNASSNVQDGLMELLLSGSLNSHSFTNTVFGLTGNMGALDGTHAQKPSTALLGRLASCIAVDSPEAFCARLRQEKRLNDRNGAAFVDSLLYRYPSMLSVELDKLGEQTGSYQSSRSWYDTMDELRDCLDRHGGRAHIMEAREEFIEIVERGVGVSAAKTFDGFIEAILKKADPLAAKIVLSNERMKTETVVDAVPKGTDDDLHFQYAFADSLVSYTLNRIAKEDKLDEACHRFGIGTAGMTDQAFEYAVEKFLHGLTSSIYTVEGGTVKISHQVDNDKSLTNKKRVLEKPVYEMVGNAIIMGRGGIEEEMRDHLIKTLSGMNKHRVLNQDAAVKSGIKKRKKVNP